jgi:cob(I)alamin adenosyltransferase
MLKSCANPQCAKPLHYLREGRVFVFDAIRTPGDADGNRAHRLEHFWLCGTCSATMVLEKTRTGVRVIDRVALRMQRAEELSNQVMAS